MCKLNNLLEVLIDKGEHKLESLRLILAVLLILPFHPGPKLGFAEQLKSPHILLNNKINDQINPALDNRTGAFQQFEYALNESNIL
jgi:hypothetical protein